MTRHPARTYDVCGIPISPLSPAVAAATIATFALEGRSLQVHLCNAYTLSLTNTDRRLAAALSASDLNLPDGAPVAWLGKRRGTSGAVRGPSLVGHVIEIGVPFGVRHFLYGGWTTVAEDMAAALGQRYPGATIVGCRTPPPGYPDEVEIESLTARLHEAQAQVVWVGLGTPLQDYLVPELARRFDGVIVPVGAAFDFWAGRVKEAPQVLHGSGFEWVYRLVTEPRRLWRRYLLGNPRFIINIVRHRMQGARTR